MRMSFSGAPEIRATREQVWNAVLDPQLVAASVGVVESVEEIDPTHFKVVAGLGVGVLTIRFTLNVELFDLVEGQSAKMRARGKAPGSTLDATTALQLEDAAPGVIRLVWQADSDVGGMVASVGARLLEGTVRKLAEQFFKDFAETVSEQSASSA